MPLFLLLFTCATAQEPAIQPPATVAFDAPKYGLATRIPKDWKLAVHEQDDRIFVTIIPQPDFERPGIAACELALAPATLDDYRTRIDTSAKKNGRKSGKLASNQVIKDGRGERLETIWEFHPDAGGFWHEVSVRIIANRQLYTFILNVEDALYTKSRAAFDSIVNAASFTSPNTGADLLEKKSNTWIQREYRFALDLPEGWQPALAPSQVALLFANGPPMGIWSDNILVLAHPHRKSDLEDVARLLPDQLKQEDPNCQVISCKIIAQGKSKALETIVRTDRGPFSMTVIERRFRGGRFDYEVKYTVETKRFEQLLPKLRQSLESFREMPGEVPGAANNKAA
jgi:hypothetical protein